MTSDVRHAISYGQKDAGLSSFCGRLQRRGSLVPTSYDQRLWVCALLFAMEGQNTKVQWFVKDCHRVYTELSTSTELSK